MDLFRKLDAAGPDFYADRLRPQLECQWLKGRINALFTLTVSDEVV